MSNMLYVGGSKTAFSCICGCNIFYEVPVVDETDPPGMRIFHCNACPRTYEGIPTGVKHE